MRKCISMCKQLVGLWRTTPTIQTCKAKLNGGIRAGGE